MIKISIDDLPNTVKKLNDKELSNLHDSIAVAIISNIIIYKYYSDDLYIALDVVTCEMSKRKIQKNN